MSNVNETSPIKSLQETEQIDKWRADRLQKKEALKEHHNNSQECLSCGS